MNPNLADLTTIEHRSRCEKDKPKVGPLGVRRAGASESERTEDDLFMIRCG